VGRWNPAWSVVDATGIGAGLASFLQKAFGEKVIGFNFNAASKSQLGWDFLSVVETGRFKDGQALEGSRDWQGIHKETFDQQLAHCQMEVLPGAERRIKWGVPDGTRDSRNGAQVHDDLLISAALCAVLDRQVWALPGTEAIILAPDVLEDLDEGDF
jgi:hypothetical protein